MISACEDDAEGFSAVAAAKLLLLAVGRAYPKAGDDDVAEDNGVKWLLL
jgi:hypothetical protein